MSDGVTVVYSQDPLTTMAMWLLGASVLVLGALLAYAWHRNEVLMRRNDELSDSCCCGCTCDDCDDDGEAVPPDAPRLFAVSK